MRPRIVAETSSLAVMTAILRESDCLTLMSRAQAMDEFQGVGVSMLPINLRAAERVVGVTTRCGWFANAGAASLSDAAAPGVPPGFYGLIYRQHSSAPQKAHPVALPR
jgi:hypothetical protein